MIDFSTAPPGWELLVLASVAFVGSFINVNAGGGSLLVIPTMIAMGMPAPIANGTLRLGTLVESMSSNLMFLRHGVTEHRKAFGLLVPVLLGAGAGTVVATQMNAAVLEPVFGGALIGWAIVLLRRRKLEGAEHGPKTAPGRIGTWALAFGVGGYGGLLQGGVGFFMIALLVHRLGMDPVRANAAKAVLVGAYTIVALAIFANASLVSWWHGGAIAIGASLGGSLGARLQISRGASLVRVLLVVALVVSGTIMIVRAIVLWS